MTHFSEIAPVDIATNAFQLVGREWMLITAGSPNSHNTMTASWGNLGYLWNMDVAICYVRPQRHTFGFIERVGRLHAKLLRRGMASPPSTIAAATRAATWTRRRKPV